LLAALVLPGERAAQCHRVTVQRTSAAFDDLVPEDSFPYVTVTGKLVAVAQRR
jgi:hypothetical protein